MRRTRRRSPVGPGEEGRSSYFPVEEDRRIHDRVGFGSTGKSVGRCVSLPVDAVYRTGAIEWQVRRSGPGVVPWLSTL